MARPIEAPERLMEGNISVSSNAAKRIAKLLKNEDNPDQMLRVTVSGGGCSGFQYGFGFESERNHDDLAIEQDGITVLIDPVSAGYLDGSVIDYIEDLIGASFQVKNPNAVSSCGCGTSFSLA